MDFSDISKLKLAGISAMYYASNMDVNTEWRSQQTLIFMDLKSPLN